MKNKLFVLIVVFFYQINCINYSVFKKLGWKQNDWRYHLIEHEDDATIIKKLISINEINAASKYLETLTSLSSGDTAECIGHLYHVYERLSTKQCVGFLDKLLSKSNFNEWPDARLNGLLFVLVTKNEKMLREYLKLPCIQKFIISDCPAYVIDACADFINSKQKQILLDAKIGSNFKKYLINNIRKITK